MKKVFLLLLFLITIFTAVSCTENGKEEDSVTGGGTDSDTPMSSEVTTEENSDSPLPFPSTSVDTADRWSHNY